MSQIVCSKVGANSDIVEDERVLNGVAVGDEGGEQAAVVCKAPHLPLFIPAPDRTVT